jgi:hypothetical protein
MANIFDEMKRIAREIAEHAQAKISNLDQQLAEIDKQKMQINTEREKASSALKRAANFPVKLGADYLCPACWVDDDVTSTMRPAPSPDRNDIFRCNRCHFEAVF